MVHKRRRNWNRILWVPLAAQIAAFVFAYWFMHYVAQ